ncbi:MAG: hypothetical protein HYZ18_04215 [Pseudogulbenkiania sp.]|nr:hypothetical protein [Pseudogulbenkiania sp.]
MKFKKLVHPSHARCVSSEPEAARLRQAGWLELPEPYSVKPDAIRQRQLYERLVAAGHKQLVLRLPPEVVKDFTSLKGVGETREQLFERMVKTMKLIS